MPNFLATNYLLAPLSYQLCRSGWIYCIQLAPDAKNLLRRARFLSLAQLKKVWVQLCVWRKTNCRQMIHVLTRGQRYTDPTYSCFYLTVYTVGIINNPIMLFVFTCKTCTVLVLCLLPVLRSFFKHNFQSRNRGRGIKNKHGGLICHDTAGPTLLLQVCMSV